MRKITNYVIVFLLTFIVINFNVYAECSYQERKDLLNASKNVDIFYEIDTRQEEVYVDSVGMELRDIEFLSIKVTNVTDNFFIKATSEYDNSEIFISKNKLVDGIFTIDQDFVGNIYKYNFEFYSNNNNCLGNSITKRSLTIPIYNVVSSHQICNNDYVSDSKYCKKYITEEFDKTTFEIVEELEKKVEEKESIDAQTDDKNILTKILICIGILGGIGLILFIILYIRKRRSSLWKK